MKVALVCPASLPATQFGGIVFLAVDLAREISKMDNEVTIYTTDLDFSNGPNRFNKNLPRLEKFEKFKINRTHVWFSLKLFFINSSMLKQIEKDKPDKSIESISPKSDWSWSFMKQAESFVETVLSGKKSIANANDGLKDIEFIEKIWKRII